MLVFPSFYTRKFQRRKFRNKSGSFDARATREDKDKRGNIEDPSFQIYLINKFISKISPARDSRIRNYATNRFRSNILASISTWMDVRSRVELGL